MKILLVNGSGHRHGCTDAALQEMEKVFKAHGAEAEIYWIGNQPVGGCIGCGACYQTGKCVFGGGVNEFVEKARDFDAFVFGTPVHYAAASGNLTCLLDRAFFIGSDAFRRKPCAVIASARRAGTTAAYEQLLKYPGITEMPIISSSYWNMVHGRAPEDVAKDEEGLRTLRVLAKNMVYFLQCMEAGRKAGVPEPEPEPRVMTNFIR
ncbi:MAG: flavodoxin family protein [Clostridia bacterium]|nr:flavodoxin family protein [Clostridia bacterium]